MVYVPQPYVSGQQQQPQQIIIKLKLTILQGTGLVAKDRNLLGRKTTSDPYVEVWANNEMIAKTCTIWKTLDPTWNETFTLKLSGDAPKIALKIWDEDRMSEPDAMGTVTIEIPTKRGDTTEWYDVPKNSAKHASGQLQVRLETVRHKKKQDTPKSKGKNKPPTMVRSSKRGVCANKLSLADARALAPGVSWFYNWYFQSDDIYPDVDLTFYPMVWGSDPAMLAGLKNTLTKSGDRRPDHVLVLNEPNLKGQAFLSPQQAASLYRSVREITNPLGISLIGPHMAIGSSEESSVKAFDPIEGKKVTYTYMIPYLDAFYYYLGFDDSAPAIAVHSYGNIGELTWLIGMLEETYPGKEIWITEFAWWGASNQAELIEYMREAVKLFERRPSVAKYAWFKERMGGENRSINMSLFTDKSGELTALGKTYVNLPVGTK
jgi:hypothetical protein